MTDCHYELSFSFSSTHKSSQIVISENLVDYFIFTFVLSITSWLYLYGDSL